MVCPQSNDEIETDPDYLNLSSGYIKRSLDIFPQQGKKRRGEIIKISYKMFSKCSIDIDDGEIFFSKFLIYFRRINHAIKNM